MNVNIKEYQGKKLWYHKLLIDELSYISSLLKKHSIPFWIMAGTLLGAARNNHIISWDDDIDLGIFLSDFDRLSVLKSEVILDGFKLKLSKRVSRLFFSKIKSHLDISSIKFHVDIFTHSVESGKVTTIYNPRHNCSLLDLKEMDEIEFEGGLYPCPRNYKDYLIRAYGIDWEIPKYCNHDIKYIKSFDPINQDILDEIKKYEMYRK